jgi:NAD(P)-dependent dehydrogenase (short-subunit alcohol dehydrogenase family)
MRTLAWRPACITSSMATRQPSQREQPKPPFPPQHQDKPGLESKLEPRPHYQAPAYKPAGKLVGKRALITGGDSGIGRAVAVVFAREGADIAINYLAAEQSDADETRRAVEACGRTCVQLPGDLTDAAFCRELVERAHKELGGLDILVSNAAYQNRKPIDKLTPDELDRTFRTNIYAYFFLAQAAIAKMPPGSSIIATSSTNAFSPSESLPDYSATKGAINQLTKVLAQQLVERKIRVNAVAPGPVWTPLNTADEGATDEQVKNFGAQTPLKRPAQPEELAPAYVFLASEADSSYITGIVLPVLGGETIGG